MNNATIYGQTALTAMRMPYWELFNYLTDDVAHAKGIIDEHTDVRLAAFLDRVWECLPLRHWLNKSNDEGDMVNLGVWLRLMGWVQSHDLLADRVSKRDLAFYLWTVLGLKERCSEHNLRRYMTTRRHSISKVTNQRLQQILDAKKGG